MRLYIVILVCLHHDNIAKNTHTLGNMVNCFITLRHRCLFFPNNILQSGLCCLVPPKGLLINFYFRMMMRCHKIWNRLKLLVHSGVKNKWDGEQYLLPGKVTNLLVWLCTFVICEQVNHRGNLLSRQPADIMQWSFLLSRLLFPFLRFLYNIFLELNL